MPNEILGYYLNLHPELAGIDIQARRLIYKTKKAIFSYQAAALYHLALPYNGGNALEIGTAYGYSCFFLAKAMPDSKIITLNASESEVQTVRETGILSGFSNVRMLHRVSWKYLKETEVTYNFVFVDGDHNRVRLDFPYFNRLIEGGLILFHDYSPLESERPCPPVYQAVNELSDKLGRQPDILIIDSGNVGMAGFVRQVGEQYEVY